MVSQTPATWVLGRIALRSGRPSATRVIPENLEEDTRSSLRIGFKPSWLEALQSLLVGRKIVR